MRALTHRVDQAARLIAGVLEGDSIAKRALARIAADVASPDEMLAAILEAIAADGRHLAPTPALRGACRAIQKSIEESRLGATT